MTPDPSLFARDSILHSIALLRKNGVPFSTIIDIGCADGTFSLTLRLNFGKHLKALNLDPQPAYEPSLAKISRLTGAHYKITAVAASNGTLNWSTNPDSPYWSQAGTPASQESVPCSTLDDILAEFPLFGPFLIKLDIEGHELDALLGAPKTLAQSSILVIETPIWYGPHTKYDFCDLAAFLRARSFSLFDITGRAYRNGDAVLFQIYTTWLHRDHEFRHLPLPPAPFSGDPAQSGLPTGQELAAAMQQRRASHLEQIDKLLALWNT